MIKYFKISHSRERVLINFLESIHSQNLKRHELGESVLKVLVLVQKISSKIKKKYEYFVTFDKLVNLNKYQLKNRDTHQFVLHDSYRDFLENQNEIPMSKLLWLPDEMGISEIENVLDFKLNEEVYRDFFYYSDNFIIPKGNVFISGSMGSGKSSGASNLVFNELIKDPFCNFLFIGERLSDYSKVFDGIGFQYENEYYEVLNMLKMLSIQIDNKKYKKTFLIFEELEAFLSKHSHFTNPVNYGEFFSLINKILKDGNRFGIYTIATASNSSGYMQSLLNLFPHKMFFRAATFQMATFLGCPESFDKLNTTHVGCFFYNSDKELIRTPRISQINYTWLKKFFLAGHKNINF